MNGFYVRGLSDERQRQLREQAHLDMRDMRDEAAVLIAEALDMRLRQERSAARADRRLVAAS